MMKFRTMAAPVVAGLLGLGAAAGLAQGQTIWDAHGTLQVSPDKRFLQHVDGTPFFWLGGTAWGMGSRTTREDVDHYLDDRQAKGFTVVQAVVHWRHSAGPESGWGPKVNNPVNRYGHIAFEGGEADPDTTRPLINPGGGPDAPNDYWDHIDYIVRETRERGMALALLPTWGLQSITSSDPNQVVFTEAEARAYGEFIGQRYGNQPHIIWTMGGDSSPYPTNKYNAMAQGVETGVSAAGGANPLMTFHPGSGSSGVSAFDNQSWLDINMVQTGQRGLNEVTQLMTSHYNRAKTRPVINGEAAYEGVTQWAGNLRKTPVMVRRTAYQSYFAGAAGYTYGHEPGSNSGMDAIWALGTDRDGWQALLDAPGAQDMTHLKDLVSGRAWWKWVPDNSIVQNDTARLLVAQKVDGNQWFQVGRFNFDGTALVEISNVGTDGYVIADGVRFQRVSDGAEVILDSSSPTGITVVGSWTSSNNTSGYIGDGYLHDGNTGKGDKRITYSAALTGEYRVALRWASDANRASAVPVGINGELLGSNMLEHAAVRSADGDEILVYFAASSPATISLAAITAADQALGQWFNPADGTWLGIDGLFDTSSAVQFTPPESWEDAVLLLTAVPEPAVGAPIMLGMLALAARRRRC